MQSILQTFKDKFNLMIIHEKYFFKEVTDTLIALLCWKVHYYYFITKKCGRVLHEKVHFKCKAKYNETENQAKIFCYSKFYACALIYLQLIFTLILFNIYMYLLQLRFNNYTLRLTKMLLIKSMLANTENNIFYIYLCYS